jgi:hypothetical protein
MLKSKAGSQIVCGGRSSRVDAGLTVMTFVSSATRNPAGPTASSGAPITVATQQWPMEQQ